MYHHFAAQCVELARTMDSALDRSVLLEMALVWSRLAEYAAKTVARKERAELETARGRREAAGGHLGQILRLSLQPTADDASAHLAIGRPILRETMVHNVVGFDAECVLDDLGGAIAAGAIGRRSVSSPCSRVDSSAHGFAINKFRNHRAIVDGEAAGAAISLKRKSAKKKLFVLGRERESQREPRSSIELTMRP